MEYLGNLGSSLSLVSQFLWDNVISTSQSRACEALVNISNNSTFTPESEFYAQFREAHWYHCHAFISTLSAKNIWG
jgi:hypothetical protein